MLFDAFYVFMSVFQSKSWLFCAVFTLDVIFFLFFMLFSGILIRN
jgi:hypothetical protein